VLVFQILTRVQQFFTAAVVEAEKELQAVHQVWVVMAVVAQEEKLLLAVMQQLVLAVVAAVAAVKQLAVRVALE
jgi:hypothetical protein